MGIRQRRAKARFAGSCRNGGVTLPPTMRKLLSCHRVSVQALFARFASGEALPVGANR